MSSLPKYWQVTAFMHSLLDVGSSQNDNFCQTVSNSLALVDANEIGVRQLLTPDEDEEDTQLVYSVMLDEVASVWKCSPRMFEIIVSALMYRTLLPPDKLLKWVGATDVGFVSGFDHMGLILMAAAINAIPHYVNKSFNVNLVEYLGDCTTAALDPLIIKACEKHDSVERASEDEVDDATVEMKEVADKVRCVVRHCLSMRAAGGDRLLDANTATSVLSRVITEDTPAAIKECVELLTREPPLY